MLAVIMTIENEADRGLAERLYLNYSQPMFRVANAILRDESRAEDAVADTFERIIKNIDQFHGLSCNKTRGLIVIYVRSICFNILKRDKLIGFSALDEDAPGEGPPPEELVIDREVYGRLLKIISTLDYKYRDILRLKYFNGLSAAEIADILDISPENVRVRLHRAKLKLKKALGEVNTDGS